MRTWFLAVALSWLTGSVWAQPGQVWYRTYGGNGSDEARTIDPATGGGYVIAGYTTSSGAGGADFYLVRIDEGGNILWSRTYGGSSSEGLEWVEVQRTHDGGYFLAGESNSFGAGSYDFYVIKTDSGGNVLWTRTYGGASVERPRDAIEMKDGSFVIVGYSCTFASGYADFYVVRIDGNGNLLWAHNYGGTGIEDAHSVCEAPDHGLVITGYTTSYGHGGADVYVVRTDVNGAVQWTRSYGGPLNETVAEYVRVRPVHGGYVMATFTQSFGHGGYDAYLLAIDHSGNELWTRTFGSLQMDDARDVIPTSDGGYLLGGYSFASDPTGDYYLVKTDSAGNEVWSECFGGPGADWVYSVQEARDGGYLAVGKTAHGTHPGWEMAVFRLESDSPVPPEFAPVDTTDYPYPIQVDSAFIDDQSLEPGDMIAVFDGTLSVGRATVDTWPVTITAWGMDSVNGLPGFIEGDSIRYRVWSRARNLALQAQAAYIVGDGTFGYGGGSEVVLHASTEYTLTIPLRGRYAEWISLNLIPSDLSAQSVFGTVTYLETAYDDFGRAYSPHGLNTIGSIQVAEGYRLLCRRADTLVVHGRWLNPNTPYPLVAQTWSWLGYPLRVSTPTQLALGGIVNQLAIITDADGNVWIPSLGICTLTTLEPGHAYGVYMWADMDFVYPQNMSVMSNPDNDHLRPRLPVYANADGVPYTVIVNVTDNIRQHNPTSVELYDRSVCVGRASFAPGSTYALVTAWQAVPAHRLGGFTPGDSIVAVVLDGAHQRIAAHRLSGSVLYGVGPYADFTLESDSREGSPFSVGEAYPNPFNSAFSIQFDLPEAGDVRIRLYNTLGQMVSEKNARFAAGANRYVMDSKRLSPTPCSGVYFLEISHGSQSHLRKVLLVR